MAERDIYIYIERERERGKERERWGSYTEVSLAKSPSSWVVSVLSKDQGGHIVFDIVAISPVCVCL